MARQATKEKIDYKTGFSQNSLARTETITSKVEAITTIFNDLIREVRDIYRENQEYHQNNPEKADRLFQDYKKKANFNLPKDIKNHVFDIAVNTADLTNETGESFLRQQQNWQLRMSVAKNLSSIPDREKLEQLLNCEEAPLEKEITACLPKKPVKSIAPNNPFNQEYLNIAVKKLNLSESQQSGLHGMVIKFAKEANEEQSTNHLIKALAYCSKGDISFDKNFFKISKKDVLKTLTAPGKTAFQYEHNLIDLKKANEALQTRQEELASKNQDTQSRLERTESELLKLMAEFKKFKEQQNLPAHSASNNVVQLANA